jgi:hypothetical protein
MITDYKMDLTFRKQIEKYLDFKLGEIWEEIASELEYEAIRPITPDGDCIRLSRQMIRKKADTVLLKQKEIARKKQEVHQPFDFPLIAQYDRDEEHLFYAQFIESHKKPTKLDIVTPTKKNRVRTLLDA